MSFAKVTMYEVGCDHRSPETPKCTSALHLPPNLTGDGCRAAARERGWYADAGSHFCPRHVPEGARHTTPLSAG